MRKIANLLGLAIVILLSTRQGFAQQSQQLSEELRNLQKEIEALKQGQAAIQKDLQEIKGLLIKPPAGSSESRNAVLSIADSPSLGDKNARVAIVEFSDYQCPFCSRYVHQTLPHIDRDYIKTGRVRYIFRDFPIEAIHKDAFKAAEASSCAGEQEKFWEMHDRLYSSGSALSQNDLLQYALALGLDASKFQQCLDNNKYAGKIRKDMADGVNAGIKGTPTFFLGLLEPETAKLKVFQVITGAQPYATFKQAIDSIISSQK